MKLYTEEQVNRAIELPRTDDVYYPTKDEIVNTLTPIELPTDEEIELWAKSMSKIESTGAEEFGRIYGALWMKDKIQENAKVQKNGFES